MTKATLRTQRLERLYTHMTTVPAPQINMAVWATETDCGTVGCLAGHCMLNVPGYTMDRGTLSYLSLLRYQGRLVAWQTAAQRYLKLTEDEGNRLFAVSGWPDRYYDRYVNAKTARGRKSALLARLRHFITTGE